MRTELADTRVRLSVFGAETLDEQFRPTLHPLVLAKACDLNMVIFENTVPLRMSPTLEIASDLVRSKTKWTRPRGTEGGGPSWNAAAVNPGATTKPGDAA